MAILHRQRLTGSIRQRQRSHKKKLYLGHLAGTIIEQGALQTVDDESSAATRSIKANVIPGP